MKTRDEGIMAIAAALLVLFSAMLAPPVAAVISVFSLAAFGIYKLVQKDKHA